jgi:type IV secretion system protein TrbG
MKNIHRVIISIILTISLTSCATAPTETITPAKDITPSKPVEETIIKPEPATTEQVALSATKEKLVEIPKQPASSSKTENLSPADVIKAAQKKASQRPTRERSLNAITMYDYIEGALYKVICAPDHVTDVILQPGEVLTGQPAGGDTVRWIVGVTNSKTGTEKTYHVLIQPMLPGLSTNMILATDKHLYHLELVSRQETYQTALSWRYPQEELAKANQKKVEEENREIAQINIANINFNYKIDGKAAWKPIRVFDDGKKTYLEFPAGIQQGELPPLFIVSKDSENQLVNYRYRNNYYIVDRLFEKALLQIGNKKSEKVYVTRLNPNTDTSR